MKPRIHDRFDRVAVSRLEWVADDQAEVDVADQLAEHAVSKAPRRVGRQEPVAKRSTVASATPSLLELGALPIAELSP